MIKFTKIQILYADQKNYASKKFAERLQGCQNMPHSDRLKRLDLESLELRRLYADLIMCYEIVAYSDLSIYIMISLHLEGTVTSSSRSVIITHPFIIFVSVS